MLAKLWLDAIRKIYENGDIPSEGISPEVVKATGTELSNAVDVGFNQILKDVDYTAIDHTIREILKKNAWKFSVAKNYNDNIRINNLLTRGDGSVRPWNEFKREAMRVVGMSNRYLKTEYDTIVAGAMMSRQWQEIQRDKHIFPYAKFVVTLDNHTSDICAPLSGVVVQVDDPILQYYFPPNHFNCRTSVIKLRDATPTLQEQIPKLDLPEEFLNNTGITGEVFTDKNKYIKNTPKKVLDKSNFYHERNELYLKYKNNPDYYDVEINDLSGVKATHRLHNFDKRTGIYEKEVQNILFKEGYKVILESEDPKIEGKKVDGFLNDRSFDISSILGDGKNTIVRALKHSYKKKAEVAILYFPNKEIYSMNELNRSIARYNGQIDYRFKKIIYIVEGKINFY